jgi:hypothetical protein
MKAGTVNQLLTVLTAGALLCATISARAQDTNAPQLAYGVPQILQMSQAKVGDDAITAYIKNSGSSYGLNADQIIYLKQQGVSDAVITAMLNQPKPGVIEPATSAPQPPAAPAVVVPTPTPAPVVTYVQTPPVTYNYYQPYYYPTYYPVYYGVYPAACLSFGWGGYYRGGYYYGGWHGGYGGWHGGYGGWHGGYGGWHGGYGGWHGGYGGWHGGWHR